MVTIPVHEGCSESSEMNSNSSETDILGSERGSETKTKSSERSSETKDLIIDIIKQDPHITAVEIAMQLNMSSRGIEKQIRKLRELGKIKRTGGRFGGYWEIVIYENTIPSFASLSLQWQGDQVAKASFGHYGIQFDNITTVLVLALQMTIEVLISQWRKMSVRTICTFVFLLNVFHNESLF